MWTRQDIPFRLSWERANMGFAACTNRWAKQYTLLVWIRISTYCIAWLLVGCSACTVSLAQDFFKELQDKLGVPTVPQPEPESGSGRNDDAEALPAPKAEGAPELRTGPAVDLPAISEVPNPFAPNSATDQTLPSDSGRAEVPADRPYLGVTVEQLEGGGMGLRVVQVTTNSPGWKAGITPGDNLLAIDGVAVSSLDQLAGEILRYEAGRVVKCLIDRRGRTITLPVVLGSSALAERTGTKQPSVPGLAPYVPIGPGVGSAGEASSEELDRQMNDGRQRASLGVTVEKLSDRVRDQLGVPVHRGAVVQVVAPNSPAQRAGLLPGDCIVGADGVAIGSDVDLMNWVLSAQPGQIANLQYFRSRSLENVKIRLEGTNAPVQTTDQQRLRPELDDIEVPNVSGSNSNDEQILALESQLAALRRELERTQAELEALRENR